MTRGNSMVGLLVTVAIIAILMVVFFKGSNVFGAAGGKSSRADDRGTTVPGLVMAKAEDQVCRSNLNQVRSSITIARSNGDDEPPANLKDLRLPSDFYRCPMGHEPYKYDPQAGTVSCVHPGHEKY